jgi:hypothetical protein
MLAQPPLSPARRACVPALVLWLALLALAVGGCSRGEPFPVADYRKNPANLNGNHYVLEAEVDSQLRAQEGVGRIISVRPLGDKGRLPVFVPDALGANLVPAQRYRFGLAVRTGGLLYVSRLDKI